MENPPVIALDAMGGDKGPEVVIPGAELALVRHPDITFTLVGDKAQIAPLLERHPRLGEKARVVHTDVAVPMDAKPSQALRQGRRVSSMWLALEAVRDGEADVMISAGNTGALMAMAKFCLKTMPGIDRPAIAAIWPTISSECVVLDVGANVGATADLLIDFALMGAEMARGLFGLERPRVKLLNIGVEEVKGLEEVRKAHAWLREQDLPFRYEGFMEGDQIGHDGADVVVTEGFSGNIALKTAEGTAKQIAEYLRAAINRSAMSRLGGFLAQDAFRALKEKMDPRRNNGGLFLGLNGLVIKSHGGTDATGFASAIDLGYDMCRTDLIERIRKDLAALTGTLTGESESATGRRIAGMG